MTRALLFPCLLSLTMLQHLQAQHSRFDVATHAGVNSDGRFMLGGQLGAHIAGPVGARLSATFHPTVNGAAMTIADASLRAVLSRRLVRPYLLAGVAFEHVTQSGFPTRNDWGIAAGGGVEGGQGVITGFIEARLVRIGTVLSELRGYTAGWFWGGLRFHFGR